VESQLRNNQMQAAEQAGDRRITVWAQVEGRWIVVQICDNGPGIPEDLRAKVFDSFLTTKLAGTGLGLSLCKRFVESHGGFLELQPAGQKPGACFQICLPTLLKETGSPVLAVSVAVRV